MTNFSFIFVFSQRDFLLEYNGIHIRMDRKLLSFPNGNTWIAHKIIYLLGKNLIKFWDSLNKRKKNIMKNTRLKTISQNSPNKQVLWWNECKPIYREDSQGKWLMCSVYTIFKSYMHRTRTHCDSKTQAVTHSTHEANKKKSFHV